jgi:hypothetical protein
VVILPVEALVLLGTVKAIERSADLSYGRAFIAVLAPALLFTPALLVPVSSRAFPWLVLSLYLFILYRAIEWAAPKLSGAGIFSAITCLSVFGGILNFLATRLLFLVQHHFAELTARGCMSALLLTTAVCGQTPKAML